MALPDQRKAINAAKRAAKITTIEAAKAPENRIANRDDFDAHIYKQLTIAREAILKDIKQWFIDFVVHPSIGICSTVAEGKKYFVKNGTSFTTSVIRKFLQCQAEIRTGKLAPQMSFKSVQSLLNALVSAAKQHQNPIVGEVRYAAHCWIIEPLITQGIVSTVEREKCIITSMDIIELTRTLFSIPFMATLHNSRSALLIALYLGLAVDCCEQINKFLRDSASRIKRDVHKDFR